MHISRLDLNLLLVLDAIYTERGVTQASKKLNLTQPAVSHALGRLRDALGDPLFVRAGKTLAPTARARSLIEPVRTSLRQMELALSQFEQFDPRSMARRFNVGLRGALELTLLAPLMARIDAAAPNVEIATFHVERRTMEADLASGTMDVAVDVPLLPLGENIRHQLITTDRLVVLARPGHPAVRNGRIDFRKYLKQDHIVVTSRRRAAALEDIELSRLGLQRRVRLHAQHYAAACEVVTRTDFLLTMLERYARSVNRVFGNQILNLPFEVLPIQFYMYWHDTTDQDSAGHWLRDQLVLAAKDQAPLQGL